MSEPTTGLEDFEVDEEEVAETEAEEIDAAVTEELDEVDVTDEEESEDAEDDEKLKGVKKVGKKKANARPPVPEGFIAPVAFAKVLTAELVKRGELDEDEEIPPQMIYSYIKNTAGGKDPLKSYSEGGRNNLLKQDEALAWWDRKTARAEERRAAKKAKKAAAKAEESAEDATEAEDSE